LLLPEKWDGVRIDERQKEEKRDVREEETEKRGEIRRGSDEKR
jgi:hypothetical protein